MKARHSTKRRSAKTWLALTLAMLQGASEFLALQRKHR
ncbi:hypothetical protein MCEMSEM22_01363 [Comamonadaceae bacterium]|jgi:hypothetical protein